MAPSSEHYTKHHKQYGTLLVADPIADFVRDALSEEPIAEETFWNDVSRLFADLTPRNLELLAERDRLQQLIDDYHRASPGLPDPVNYRSFLEEIGYLRPNPGAFKVSTANVDPEMALTAGPQLVVPLLNARFAINAANARWGSLYDALYGADVIAESGELKPGSIYNPKRGAEVIAHGRQLLDLIAPLVQGSHSAASAYKIVDDALIVDQGGRSSHLRDPSVFIGFNGTVSKPTAVLLKHHGLHVEIQIDPDGSIGRTDPANIQDLLVESAITTIMDLEDSVAAVDATDKAMGYLNWRGLVMGTLTEEVTKDDRTFTRRMNPDREYLAPDGTDTLTLPGRSMLLVRNVGHLMTTDAVLSTDGQKVPEGILDAVMTALAALPDLRGDKTGTNSRTGSLYIVKPKMHGPDEVAFTVELFGRVETLLGLPQNTIKVGIMDEERRTTVNLPACIHAASARAAFINTGFLDRTGDEIHTSIYAGPVVPKAQLKVQSFISAYEDWNVDCGLAAGFPGHAQIGKGMWAMPDLMAEMMKQKIGHVRSGANTAWVPSPTAATLHALHYHQVDVSEVQITVAARQSRGITDILIPPIQVGELTPEAIQEEIDNNVQSILGYVVRWVDQGIGASKVPDIHGVALMEDRATLRISSQLLANWLLHGLITIEQIDESLERLSSVVDQQNADDSNYLSLIGPNGPGIAYQSARRLILEGSVQPNGYTEPILHEMRKQKKAELAAH